MPLETERFPSIRELGLEGKPPWPERLLSPLARKLANRIDTFNLRRIDKAFHFLEKRQETVIEDAVSECRRWMDDNELFRQLESVQETAKVVDTAINNTESMITNPQIQEMAKQALEYLWRCRLELTEVRMRQLGRI